MEKAVAVEHKMIKKSNTGWLNYLKNNYDLYLMLIPGMIFYIVFKYGPMYGILMAFQDYNIFAGVFHSKWVGLDVFKQVMSEKTFWKSFGATMELNILSLIVSFPAPIIFAILLNEIKSTSFKRVVQSISYMPHFISWVIVYGLIVNFTMSDTGLFNVILTHIGSEQIAFLTTKKWWIVVYLVSHVWKEVGWSCIIYLSALSSIDPSLYEAAEVDGAGRFQKMWHITLPGIKSTIVIMLILAIGKLVSIGFEQPFLLGNAMVSDLSNVLSVYIYNNGILQSQWSFTTAIGLFQSVINFILVMSSNKIATLLGEDGLFGGKRK